MSDDKIDPFEAIEAAMVIINKAVQVLQDREKPIHNTTQVVIPQPPLPDWVHLRTIPLWSDDGPCAAKILNIGKSSAYAAANSGEIPTIRIGRLFVVPTYRLWAMLSGQEYE